jgi:PhnB protein
MEIKEIAPYLIFNGTCGEAFRFYHSVLGGKLDMQTYGQSPAKDHVPAASHDRVIHARLSIGTWGLMGSDDASPEQHTPGAGTQVTVTVGSAADGQQIFNALAEGGKISMKFDKTFWSPGFGMLTDRFGMPWMVNTQPQVAET